MYKLLEKLNFPVHDFDVIKEYLEQFKNYEILEENVNNYTGAIKLLCNDEIFKILFLEISDGKWWSIYRYHNDNSKFEQIDILSFDEIRDNKYNQVIKYSAHFEDENYSYLTCSGHSYLNGEFCNSWKQSRTIPVSELPKVQYSKSMNLTELIIMTDRKCNNIIKEEYVENDKVLKLINKINK